ncbi:hypothetical protein AVEN_120566-1 [Araneus ventricosus]|uniref:Uncharacterized protein n=1 Tax=Araneus ventricosus TaxID=182803 RepID=A0A4Y2H9K8_ARAVE|nr:hypothetical protein AVEN_120566-1 [Araneus ventricosus]
MLVVLKGSFGNFSISSLTGNLTPLPFTRHLIPADNLKFSNYTTYRSDRLAHRGGYTREVIRNCINHNPTPISTTSFENTSVSIGMNDSKALTLSSIYLPRHCKINTSEHGEMRRGHQIGC